MRIRKLTQEGRGLASVCRAGGESRAQVRRIDARVRALEAGNREGWPGVLMWQSEHMTDAEAEAELARRVRETGWPGDVASYPGKAYIVRWLRPGESAGKGAAT